LVVAVWHAIRAALQLVAPLKTAFNRSKKMKDLLVILGVLAFVLIIPTMGWISSRLEAARNRKRDPRGELSRRD
jgi:hypothetical protein